MSQWSWRRWRGWFLLGALSVAGGVVGGAVSGGSETFVPSASAVPVVSGSATEGQTLSATAGSWTATRTRTPQRRAGELNARCPRDVAGDMPKLFRWESLVNKFGICVGGSRAASDVACRTGRSPSSPDVGRAHDTVATSAGKRKLVRACVVRTNASDAGSDER